MAFVTDPTPNKGRALKHKAATYTDTLKRHTGTILTRLVTTMPRRDRLLCATVILFMLGSLWLQSGTGHRTWQHVSCQDSTASNPERKRPLPLQAKGTKYSGRTSISCLPIRESHHPSRRSQSILSPSLPYTRYWFDHSVRNTSCSATETLASPESTTAPRTLDRLPARGTDQAPDRKTSHSLSPHNQSQPHRTFLVHQDSRRALLPSSA